MKEIIITGRVIEKEVDYGSVISTEYDLSEVTKSKIITLSDELEKLQGKNVKITIEVLL